jgi:DNA-binding NarL/FixJ family response regulator
MEHEQSPKVDDPSAEDLKIINLMAMGHCDDHIAKVLVMSVRTARRRIARIMSMLEARNRFAAGVAAAQRGWLESGGNARTEHATSGMSGSKNT